MKRLLLAMSGLCAVAIGLIAVAGVGAQEDSPTETPSANVEAEADGPLGDYITKLAENLGISEDELRAAMKQTNLDLIDQAVADGRLSEEQAADIKAKIEEDGVLFPPIFGGHGPGGPGFPGGPGGPGFGPFIPLFNAAADILGIDEDELHGELKDGSSLAEVAEAHGISADDFRADLLASVKSKLDEKVADGDLTQARADNIYTHLTENIDDIVNATPGDGPALEFGGGPGFPGGPGFAPRFGTGEAPEGGFQEEIFID